MDLAFLSQQDVVPGFRPRCKISAAASADSGLGGLGGSMLDMASSLLGAPQVDPWNDHLRSIELTLAPAPFLSTARLQLAYGSTAPVVAQGDELKIELGYADNLQGVLTGKVLMFDDNGRDTREILIGCGGHALSRIRQYVSFENRSLNDVLQQWAGEVQLTTGNIATGPSYPFLAIDDSRSLWEWSAILAAHIGAWVWTDADNKLTCKLPGEPGRKCFSYGKDLLDINFSERSNLFGEIAVNGEGSASSQGEQAWSWLNKQTTNSTGQNQSQRLYQNGALRNIDASNNYLKALATNTQRQLNAIQITVPGSAELGLGQTFDIAACPDGKGNGSYIINQLCHRYNFHGFITELHGVAA